MENLAKGKEYDCFDNYRNRAKCHRHCFGTVHPIFQKISIKKATAPFPEDRGCYFD